MNTSRDAQGKYANKRRKRVRRVRFIIFIILVIISVSIYKDFRKSNSVIETPISMADKHQSEIDKIKDRENFKKRVENQAKQVFLSEEIADRNAKIDALKAEISEIEKDLELTRKEELSLQ